MNVNIGTTVESIPPSIRLQQVEKAAKSLEASFLSEMLKSAGLGKMPSEMGGGAGEDHFGSFLRDEQAKILVENGGIGLTAKFIKVLSERSDV